MQRGGEIFPPARFPKLRRFIRGARSNMFDRKGLDRVLLDEFGGTGFHESMVRMTVPAVEGEFGEVHIYKTPHHPDYKRDWKNSVVEVAQATSAAPVYLEAVHQGGYALIDGGLFANDPIMVAVVDALACFDVPRSRIKILSLGCLQDHWNLRQVQKLGKGWAAWLSRSYEVTGSLQTQNTQGQAGLLVGPENVLRINAPQPDPRISLDDWLRARTELPTIAASLVDEFAPKVRKMFFNTPAQPYRPIYSPERPPPLTPLPPTSVP